MKKIILLASLICLGVNYSAQNISTQPTVTSSHSYTPLTEERFNQIEDLLAKQIELNPIIIKDVPRGELIKFYIKSYNDDIVSTWMDFAYKKMTKAKAIEIDSIQDKSLKEIMKLKQNRANMFKFMSAMTNEQITIVGY